MAELVPDASEETEKSVMATAQPEGPQRRGSGAASALRRRRYGPPDHAVAVRGG